MAHVSIAESISELEPPIGARALLFDWDGTLFDNHQFNFRVLCQALAEFRVHIEEDWFHHNSGFSARRIVGLAVEKEGSSAKIEDIIDARNRIANIQLREARPIQPLHELIQKNGHLLQGIVTGSERSSIQPLLELHGLVGHMKTIVARDDVTHGKPDPEGYIQALRNLDVDSAQAVAYEDSDQGVAAANAAGIVVIDVRNLNWSGSAKSGRYSSD